MIIINYDESVNKSLNIRFTSFASGDKHVTFKFDTQKNFFHVVELLKNFPKLQICEFLSHLKMSTVLTLRWKFLLLFNVSV